MITFDECGLFRLERNFTHMRRTMRFDELIFMTAGTVYFAVGSEELTLNPGDVVFVPHGVHHYGWRESPGAVEFYWMHFLTDEPVSLPVQAHLKNPGTVFRLFRQLFDVAPLSGEDADCAATLLLHGVGREVEGVLRPHAALASDVCRYIGEHFTENITVASIAALFGYSADYISSKVRAFSGMSAKNYITHCRIQNAKSVLLQSRLTVSETALECGFSDPKQFFKLFKKHFGMTPSEYRGTYISADDVGMSVKRRA